MWYITPMKNEPLFEKYVEISWCPADIKAIRPTWSDEKCMQVLADIGGTLEDRSIELGWEVIESLLDDDYEEEDEDA